MKFLKKKVRFFGEPTEIWEIPLICILGTLGIALYTIFMLIIAITAAISWILFPSFRKWVQDTRNALGDMLGY